MAFENKDIFNLTRYVANKESLSGYINLDDFNLNLKAADIIALKEKIGLSNDYGVGVPLSRKQKGVSLISDDQIIQFKKKATVSFSSGIATLPNDYFRYETARVASAYEPVEILSSAELSKRIGNAIDEPDALFPAGEFIGDKFYIYPTTITAATLIYWRYPATPIFDYYIDANGEIVPLAEGATHLLGAGEVGSAGQTSGTTVSSLTVEHEWGGDSAIDITWIILQLMGINLGRQDLFALSNKLQKES